ncbi:MAG: response regulator [Thalassovita sp.]
MKSAQNEQQEVLPDSPSGRYTRLVDRYLNVLVAMISVGLVVILVRTVQMGWDRILLTQLGLAALLWSVLVGRKRLPGFLVIGSIYLCILVFVVLGAYRFGLIEPALYLFISLPIASAVIWGLGPGLASLALVNVVLFGLAYKFVYWDTEIAFDATAYLTDPTNWAIFLVAISLNAAWCILLVNLQRNFWIASLKELKLENERRLESERQRSEAKTLWQSAAENIPGVLFDYIHHDNDTFTFENISNGCKEIWGVEADEIYADPAVILATVPKEHIARIRRTVLQSRKNMSAFSIRFQSEVNQGVVKWVQMTGRPRPEENKITRWHCVALDITREVEAENEAIKQTELAQQVQRQKSIGQLTGGVAHDFNNLLAVVVSTLELVREDPTAEDCDELIENAMEATRQGIDLTRNMLAFSRQAPLAPKTLDLNTVIEATHSWIGRTIPANVIVTTALEDQVWPVMADESSTVSALLNLVVNARDAMPDGGTVTISTSNVTVTADQAATGGNDVTPGRYALITVKDTGAGMPPEILARVFEPFFTTKEVGAGTGLGLPMVHGFMKQSGGTVIVHSKVGQGTEFKMYFPAIAERAAPPTAATGQVEQSVTQGARLLVVEDEPKLLSVLNRTLTRAGYEVVTAASGDAALELFQSDSRFDLLLSDIVMPGILQGTMLAEELRALTPDLPVIFMSGYSQEFAELGKNVKKRGQLLMKPVKKSDLLTAIEHHLEPK